MKHLPLVLCLLLFGCTTSSTPPDVPDDTPGTPSSAAYGLVQEDRLIIYVAPEDFLVPDTLAQMDRGEPLGVSWVRLDVPNSVDAAEYDMSNAFGAPTFMAETTMPDPDPHLDQPRHIVFRFAAGAPGVTGNLQVEPDPSSQGFRVGYLVHFEGYYDVYEELDPIFFTYEDSNGGIQVPVEDAP